MSDANDNEDGLRVSDSKMKLWEYELAQNTVHNVEPTIWRTSSIIGLG
jgi:hypothetical protein